MDIYKFIVRGVYFYELSPPPDKMIFKDLGEKPEKFKKALFFPHKNRETEVCRHVFSPLRWRGGHRRECTFVIQC